MTSMQVDSQFHHYVPQFYLRAWSTTIRKRQNQLWIYERGSAEPFAGSVQKTAGEENAYAIHRGGVIDSTAVETILSKMESNWARVIQKVRRRERVVSDDRRVLSEFLAMMMRRVKYTQDKAEAFSKEMLPLIVKELNRQASEIKLDSKREIALRNIGKVADEAARQSRSIGAMTLLEPPRIADHIEEMDWGFMIDPTASLLTSDTPFVFDRSLGIGDFTNGHIIFPVAPDLWIHAMNWSRFKNQYIEMSEAICQNMNLRIIVSANQQVYSNRHSLEIQRLVNWGLGKALE